MERIIIAIDGPAASGKSTTAKLLAKKLDYTYLDTGAMYRACALQAMRQGIALEDRAAISAMMDTLEIKIEQGTEGNLIYLSGEDISAAIRTPEVSNMASAISAIPEVRIKMVELQRRLGEAGGVILDGRDIGTVVFPNAQCKFFLVADIKARAMRRFLELQAKGMEVSLEQITMDLEARDKADSSRAMAPLKPAPDAIIVDTGKLSIKGQVNKLWKIIRAKLEEL
ncbi:MAG: (d)CMP kinase [Candidatus Cloacimonetes bacterium]|nr:(d)CMP kinase [Candidatus Cloacimonadota bacterium]